MPGRFAPRSSKSPAAAPRYFKPFRNNSAPPAGPTDIIRLQQATAQSGVGGTTLTVSLPADVGIGDHIIVATGFSGALGLTVAVTDAAGNTYNTDVLADDGSSTGAYSALSSCKVTSFLTAGQLITMTVSGSVTHRMMIAIHYGGLDPTTWFDSGDNTGKGTSTNPASGALTTPNTDLVLGVCSYNVVGPAHTPGAGWSEIDDIATTSKGLAVDEQINVAPGSYTDTGTLGSSVLWSNAIGAYRGLVVVSGVDNRNSPPVAVTAQATVSVTGVKGAARTVAVTAQAATNATSSKGAQFASVVSARALTTVVSRKSATSAIVVTSRAVTSALVQKGALSVTGVAYRTDVLTDNPVGYWRLGESAGTVAVDQSTSALNGTYHGTYVQGAAGLLTGDSDTAVTFSSGDVTMTGQTVPGAPLYLTAGTVEAWIKTTDNPAAYRPVINKRFAYGMFVKSGVLIEFDYTSGQDRSSGVTVSDGIRHQVALVFDSGVTNGSQLYIDGVAAGSPFTMTVLDQTAEVLIGSDPAGNFSGDIDEVAIYPTKLLVARLASHYVTGTAPVPGRTTARATTSATGSAATANNRNSPAILVTAKATVSVTGQKGALRAVSTSAQATVSTTIRKGALRAIATTAQSVTYTTIRKGSVGTVALSAKALTSILSGKAASRAIAITAQAVTTTTGQKGALRVFVVTAQAATSVSVRKGAQRATLITAQATGTGSGRKGGQTNVSTSARAVTSYQAAKGAKGATSTTAQALIFVTSAHPGQGSVLIQPRALITVTARKAAAGTATCLIHGQTSVTTSHGALRTVNIALHGVTSTSGRKDVVRTLVITAQAVSTTTGRKNARGSTLTTARPVISLVIPVRAFGTALFIARATIGATGIKGTSAQALSPVMYTGYLGGPESGWLYSVDSGSILARALSGRLGGGSNGRVSGPNTGSLD